MGIVRRFAFYLGLVLGVLAVSTAGSVALTYLLTGKLPMVGVGSENTEVTLMTPDEVASMVREKADKARAAEVIEVVGGGDNGEE
jgi:hypothetical protein